MRALNSTSGERFNGDFTPGIAGPRDISRPLLHA
jgi:hypothetical protein